MNPKNISSIKEWNLCCGCGICVGICPQKCIRWEMKAGMYQPVIEEKLCVKCGLCIRTCPGFGHQYAKKTERLAVQGKVLFSGNAWSCNPEVRHVSASGGVVSTLVENLLKKNAYEIAFLVDGYDYRQQLSTKPVDIKDIQNVVASDFPKSRYLPVSHENAITYMKYNRDKKAVIVGTSCAVRGVCAAIHALHLQRENYLLIGLFCDRVFNYNVVTYYQQAAFSKGRELIGIHFKNKESGGWPGNMKFFYADRSTTYQDKSERANMKDFFMPERCLYCIDKLNVCADISLGDNYTQQNSSQLGSNSVIIRTERGLAAWQKTISLLEYYEVDVEQIMEAQYVDWRINNLCYGKLKEQEILRKFGQKVVLNEGILTERKHQEYRKRWQRSLQMLRAGERYRQHPEELKKQINKAERRNKQGVTNFILRAYRLLKRHM